MKTVASWKEAMEKSMKKTVNSQAELSLGSKRVCLGAVLKTDTETQ